MHRFANPTRFIYFSDKLFPYILFLTCTTLLIGLWQALFISPPDYQQGDSVRIMYVHVPSAWMSIMVYTIMAVSSASFLIWRHPLADVVARASAPLGAGFTLITLITGSLWGKPMWGTWWVWDARLTSVLILFFMYIGYIALSDSYNNKENGRKICAIMALIGFVNIPIIRFSVEWWNTLHQPASIIRSGGISIDNSMLIPLFSMGIAFVLIYSILLVMRIKTMLIQQKIRRLQFS
ncbi:MAG: heme ABC transporter permease [Pseudomonadota bacterium]|mgnify:CR=1